jgi:glycosyltransferase involved in cell wall biosynthesis
MPAMNEAETIVDVVSSVVALGYQIIVIDDASSDGTALKAKDAGAIVLSNLVNLGAWKATQSGFRYAEKLGFNIVITMDADGQHNAQHIKLLVKQYESGADVVVGNCTERGSPGRHVAWQFFKRFNRLGVSDITSGFRLYSSTAIKCLTSREATMLEYQCIGVLIMMRNLQLKIVETSVPMNRRETGISRIFNSWLAVGYYLAYSSILSLTKAFPTNKNKYITRITRFTKID